VVDARHGTEPERRATLARLIALRRVSKEDRLAAIELLEAIRRRDFAYRPNVLIMLRRVLCGGSPDEVEQRRLDGHGRVLESLGEPTREAQMTAELDRDFADSEEWLEERARTVQSPEDWLQIRVRKAEPKAANQ
jgi:hypothetical protein